MWLDRGVTDYVVGHPTLSVNSLQQSQQHKHTLIPLPKNPLSPPKWSLKLQNSRKPPRTSRTSPRSPTMTSSSKYEHDTKPSKQKYPQPLTLHVRYSSTVSTSRVPARTSPRLRSPACSTLRYVAGTIFWKPAARAVADDMLDTGQGQALGLGEGQGREAR